MNIEIGSLWRDVRDSSDAEGRGRMLRVIRIVGVAPDGRPLYVEHVGADGKTAESKRKRRIAEATIERCYVRTDERWR
jgi:hypothetical protein